MEEFYFLSVGPTSKKSFSKKVKKLSNKILIAVFAAVVSIAIGGIYILVNAYGDSQVKVGELQERTKNAQAIVEAQNKARSDIIKAKGEYDDIISEIKASKAGCVGPVIQRTISRLPDPVGHE